MIPDLSDVPLAKLLGEHEGMADALRQLLDVFNAQGTAGYGITAFANFMDAKGDGDDEAVV